jgi:nucleotide-binding universal stress UspA family protein
MALKNILVHLDDARRSKIRLALASDLARRHSAHLTGLHVMELPPQSPLSGDPAGFMGDRLIDEIMNEARDKARQKAQPVESDFRDHLRRDAIEGEWRAVEGLAAETVALHARYADLAIVGQEDPQERKISHAGQIVETTLLSSGRRVLVVPYAGDFVSLGENVLVGWKSGREAARAINDALPLLERAGSVTVLAINPRAGRRRPHRRRCLRSFASARTGLRRRHAHAAASPSAISIATV